MGHSWICQGVGVGWGFRVTPSPGDMADPIEDQNICPVPENRQTDKRLREH